MRPVYATVIFIAFAFFFSTQLVQAQLADSPWPKFRHDLRNTGRSPYSGAQDNVLRWSFQTNGSLTSPVIGLDGTVYVGNPENFYALNPDGTKKWSVDVGGVTSSPAIAADGTIYLGSYDNRFYALNPDGTKKWSVDVGGVTSSPAIAADGTIYLGSYDNRFYALNPDGTKKWSVDVGGASTPSPAIGADGTIYFATIWIRRWNGGFQFGSDNRLRALNPNGEEMWSFQVDSWIFHSPTIVGDTIYFGSSDYKLYALHENGSLKWSSDLGGDVDAPLAISQDGVVYVGAYDNGLNGWLHAVTPYGTTKWSFSVGWASLPSPTVDADGTIYFGSRQTLYALGPDRGVKWTFTIDKYSIYMPPSVGSDGTIYVVAYNTLYAIGSPAKQLQPDNTLLIAASAGVGIIALLAALFYLRRARK